MLFVFAVVGVVDSLGGDVACVGSAVECVIACGVGCGSFLCFVDGTLSGNSLGCVVDSRVAECGGFGDVASGLGCSPWSVAFAWCAVGID